MCVSVIVCMSLRITCFWICIDVQVDCVDVITEFCGYVSGIGNINLETIKGMATYDEYAFIQPSENALQRLHNRVITIICLGKYLTLEYRPFKVSIYACVI